MGYGEGIRVEQEWVEWSQRGIQSETLVSRMDLERTPECIQRELQS